MYNIICVPFAYDPSLRSGVNTSETTEKIGLYLKNACVALVSAKFYNPNCDVVFASNLDISELPDCIAEIFAKNDIRFVHVPFSDFLFDKEYLWGLAFYKLCVLKFFVAEGFDNFCFFDTDVYIQKSLDSIWKEVQENILLLDINHGLDTNNYRIFCDEIRQFLGRESYITHYGGEMFAASHPLAKEFSLCTEEIYSEMISRKFVTSRGDEFISSLAAYKMKGKIKNAGAYIYRFWTGPNFRLVSSCYKFNMVSILHVPAEKNHGMLMLFDKYISRGIVPPNDKVWKILRLSRMPIKDYAVVFVKNILKLFS